jgi:MFS family permease
MQSNVGEDDLREDAAVVEDERDSGVVVVAPVSDERDVVEPASVVQRNLSQSSPQARAADEPSGGAKPDGGPFRALKHWNFRLFWGSQIMSLIGTWMQNLAQGWLIVLLVDPVGQAMLRHGGQAVGSHHPLSKAAEQAANYYSGWINFAGGLPILLFTLFAGVIADRLEKRKMLVCTQFVFVLCSLAMGILCVTGKVQIWHVMLIAIIGGIAASFDMPTRQSFVVDLVGREDLPSAVALNASIFQASRALGPALAGLLLIHTSIGAAFITNGLLTIPPLFALMFLRLPPHQPHPDQDNSFASVLRNIREGFRFVRSEPTIRSLVILVGSFGTFAFSFNILVPVFIRYTLLPYASDAAQVHAFGTMESVRGVGAFVGAMLVAAFNSSKRQRDMLIFGSLTASSVLIVFALSRSILLANIAMALTSFGFVLCFANCNTLIQMQSPDHLRGRVMSIYMIMFIGTMPFGSLFAGALAKFIGAPKTILICALVSLATVIVVAFRPGGLVAQARLHRETQPEAG